MKQFFLPYFFLAISLAFLWIPLVKKAWYVPFIVALFFALVSHTVSIGGLALLLLMLFFCYSSRYPEKFHLPRRLADLCILLLTPLFFYHLMPGFHNWEVVSSYQFAPNCPPYSFSLRFDKGAVGLILMAFLSFPLCKNRLDWGISLKAGLGVTGIGFILLLLSTLALGYADWDIKTAPFWRVWIFYNLFFVSIAEEAFFRGFLLKKISDYYKNEKSGILYALLISSIIFGLGHFAGGPAYIFLSFIAGLLYGIAYLWSGYIESAIFTHFMVNTLHFFFFSYPCLIKNN